MVNFQAPGNTGYTYDDAGRLHSVTDVHGKTITYSYNDCGLRSGWTDQFSGTVSFTYNNMHQLTSMTDRNNETTTFEYDATYKWLKKITRANGTYTNLWYSNRHFPTSVAHKKSDGTGLRGYTYTYDSAGNPTQIKQGNNDHWDFTYDNVYQLTGESKTLASGTPVYGITYTYDNVGSRLTKVQDGQTTTYTYNNMNEMTAAGSATFTYDSNGNTASKTESQQTTNYNWDYENRLTKIDNPSGDDYVYEYDGDGMRVRSGHDSGQGNVWDTRFYYDTAAPLYAYLFESDDAKNMTVAYTIDPSGGLISQRRNSATSYYHYDALGSTRLLTDASQNVSDTYDYYAFGETQSSSGSTPNPFKFVGRLGYYDGPSTDFQYLRARYYAPAYGCFWSGDPLVSAPRRYGYASGRPLLARDPTGLQTFLPPDPAECEALCIALNKCNQLDPFMRTRCVLACQITCGTRIPGDPSLPPLIICPDDRYCTCTLFYDYGCTCWRFNLDCNYPIGGGCYITLPIHLPGPPCIGIGCKQPGWGCEFVWDPADRKWEFKCGIRYPFG